MSKAPIFEITTIMADKKNLPDAHGQGPRVLLSFTREDFVDDARLIVESSGDNAFKTWDGKDVPHVIDYINFKNPKDDSGQKIFFSTQQACTLLIPGLSDEDALKVLAMRTAIRDADGKIPTSKLQGFLDQVGKMQIDAGSNRGDVYELSPGDSIDSYMPNNDRVEHGNGAHTQNIKAKFAVVRSDKPFRLRTTATTQQADAVTITEDGSKKTVYMAILINDRENWRITQVDRFLADFKKDKDGDAFTMEDILAAKTYEASALPQAVKTRRRWGAWLTAGLVAAGMGGAWLYSQRTEAPKLPVSGMATNSANAPKVSTTYTVGPDGVVINKAADRVAALIAKGNAGNTVELETNDGDGFGDLSFEESQLKTLNPEQREAFEIARGLINNRAPGTSVADSLTAPGTVVPVEPENLPTGSGATTTQKRPSIMGGMKL